MSFEPVQEHGKPLPPPSTPSWKAPVPSVPEYLGEEVNVSAPMPINAILDDRHKKYGPFKSHAHITQELKHCIASWHRVLQKDKLADDQQEALDMICHKIGRIVNGDPNYADSWVDIAGYAQLVADRLNGVSR